MNREIEENAKIEMSSIASRGSTIPREMVEFAKWMLNEVGLEPTETNILRAIEAKFKTETSLANAQPAPDDLQFGVMLKVPISKTET